MCVCVFAKETTFPWWVVGGHFSIWIPLARLCDLDYRFVSTISPPPPSTHTHSPSTLHGNLGVRGRGGRGLHIQHIQTYGLRYVSIWAQTARIHSLMAVMRHHVARGGRDARGRPAFNTHCLMCGGSLQNTGSCASVGEKKAKTFMAPDPAAWWSTQFGFSPNEPTRENLLSAEGGGLLCLHPMDILSEPRSPPSLRGTLQVVRA